MRLLILGVSCCLWLVFTGIAARAAETGEAKQLVPELHSPQSEGAVASEHSILGGEDAESHRNEKPGLIEKLPVLVRVMIYLTLLLVVPSVSRICRLPDVVGFILTGILFGPYVLSLSRHNGPALEVFAEVGRLLLLFYAGLEMDLTLLAKAKWRISFFGVVTCLVPLMCGVALGLGFGYSPVASVLIGSLLASHTLLGYSVVQHYGLLGREPVLVTVGATIFTDTLSLIILAICVSIHTTGFSPAHLGLELAEIAVYIAIVLLGFGRLARWFFRKYQPNQEVQMVILLFVVLGAALLAELIQLESIVGAFMAGVAVNRALRGTPTEKYIEVLGKSLFLPIFFLTIGLAIDLPAVWASILSHFWFVVLMSCALVVAKLTAAWITGAAFHYSRNDRLNMWSLSLPQVAATIAAALVAYQAVDQAGHRLISKDVLSGVFVMVLVTAISGPILTEVFSRKIKTTTADSSNSNFNSRSE